jgi:hypothetical protein
MLPSTYSEALHHLHRALTDAVNVRLTGPVKTDVDRHLENFRAFCEERGREIDDHFPSPDGNVDRMVINWSPVGDPGLDAVAACTILAGKLLPEFDIASDVAQRMSRHFLSGPAHELHARKNAGMGVAA